MSLIVSLLWGILCFVILCTLSVVYIIHSHKQYFKKHKIPYIGAGVSRFVKMFTGKISFVDMEMETYKLAVACNSPVVGLTNFINLTKTIYVADMETMKNVYVKDFDHFINRPVLTSAKGDKEYFSRILFALEGEQWKGLRAKMTPMFTTGKIKRMFEIFQQSSNDMATYIKSDIGTGESKELDFSHLFVKYTMDVIAGTAFGFNCKTWEVPVGQKSQFEEMGDRYQFSFSPYKLFQLMISFISPKLYKLLGFKMMDETAEKYFEGIIKHVIKERRQTGERKDDFLQLMLDLQAGILKADDVDADEVELKSAGTSNKLTFSDFDLIANSLQFLLAGVDTTQSVLCFALYSITREQEVQQKLYEEIRSKMEQNGGKLCYDDLMDMTYLDLVLNESLRMYSPTAITQRLCTKDYPIPGTGSMIEKGLDVTLPLYPVQYDERYYPSPEKFIPERFTPENKQSRSSFAWSPFGQGLRRCIATRFALVKVKAAIAVLVYTFLFSPSPKTLIPMEFSQAVSLKPKGGLWMNVTPRH